MKSSKREKYLGDLITNGSIRNTIEDRTSKGFCIVTEIMPLERFKTETVLKLSYAMLFNGMLYNS